MMTGLLSPDLLRERAALFLRHGISPRRLAATLAIGFVLGCLPIFGIPTALCVLVALAFRLNQPAIQAANYAAMPFQLALLVPLIRLGSKLTPSLHQPPLDISALARAPWQILQHSSNQLATQLTIMAGQALLAWVVLAVPVALLLTFALTGVLRRVPALAPRRISG